MTKLDIINNALMKAGLPLAANLAEADFNAMHVYDLSVETVLRAHAWSFARRYATLEETDNPRHFGPTHAYLLPPDFLWLIDVRQASSTNAPRAGHETGQGMLFTNASPANIRYTARVPETDWPADFCEAVSSLIAAKIAALSAEKMSLVPQLMQLYNLNLNLAQAADARETVGRVPMDNPFMKSRRERE